MKRARVIPVLLLKNRGLYKTVRFRDEKYIGDPINAVKILNEKQCDELIFLDVLATRQKREIDFNLIKEIAEECFMPFSYGGGINDLNQIERVLKMGVEKIVIDTALFTDPGFLKNAVSQFGGSTIVASVDVRKSLWGKYSVFSHTGIDTSEIDLMSFLKNIEAAEAGELMINNVDLDGTRKGYDFHLAEKIAAELTLPIVFCGGCGSMFDIRKLLTETQVSAAAAGSLFVFHGPHKGVLINYPSPEEIGNIYN
jgi:imidazole glycerol-phosphate synthase subunit HisF